jgi:hypothetical protein
MSIRERLFTTKDIANAAAERRERIREEDRERSRDEVRDANALNPPPATPVGSTQPRQPTGTVVDDIARRDENARADAERAEAARRAEDAKHVQRAEHADRVAANTDSHAIFPGEEAGGFRSRWEAIQTGFVDEPRAAVEQADELVAQVVTRLAEVFSTERQQLEQQWDRGDNISTEDLRIALKRYRAFFDRLLSV